MTIERINPEGLFQSPAFSQATIAPAGRTLYIGGQNGVDASGKLAKGIEAQTRQVFENLDTILAAVGGDALGRREADDRARRHRRPDGGVSGGARQMGDGPDRDHSADGRPTRRRR
jgi:hypothetical protein